MSEFLIAKDTKWEERCWRCVKCESSLKQECIPVGCVPPAAVVIGGVWSWSPWISPLGVGLDLIPLNFPLGCGPGSDPPEFPPWVWAWIWSPSISPLAVGLDLIPLNFPLGCGPGPDPPQFPPWVWAWRGSPWQGGVSQHALRQTPPPTVNRMTDACENITLPQTSFAGGNKKTFNRSATVRLPIFLWAT